MYVHQGKWSAREQMSQRKCWFKVICVSINRGALSVVFIAAACLCYMLVGHAGGDQITLHSRAMA